MTTRKITAYEHECARCGHKWRSNLRRPPRCAANNCKSRYWQTKAREPTTPEPLRAYNREAKRRERAKKIAFPSEPNESDRQGLGIPRDPPHGDVGPHYETPEVVVIDEL